MSAPQSSKSAPAIAALVIALGLSAAAVFILKEQPRVLSGIAFGAAIVGTVAAAAASTRRKSAAPAPARLGHAELAPLMKGVTDSRTEVINAMAILQQEIRLLQDANAANRDARVMSDEVSRLGTEVAALKSAILSDPTRKLVENATRAPFPAAKTPAPFPQEKAPAAPAKPAAQEEEEDDDFDVAPLSFDDEDETPPAKAPAAKPPTFAPEPEPVLETGLEPEDMDDDDGDWLTGGLEEDDLVVTKKVDFEDIVKKDAARPKPQIDPEEQRVLREEMAQMADEEDWVGGGLQDRDVKVSTKTANDDLFAKMRAEIEAKRAQKEANAGVRAPARGETALLVNVTVPTGTKLFVRGVGPGLDVDKGAPMQQSGHGKWQWICPEQGKPCVVTVWEGDDLQAEGNPIRIPGGFALTVTPTFRRKLKL